MLKKKSKDKRISEIDTHLNDTGFKVDRKHSGRDILVLKNDDTKEVHIASRGTDPTGSKKTGVDIRQDINFALGRQAHDKATKRHVNKINKIVKEVPDDYKISMSGHSLGRVAPLEAMKTKKNVRERVTEFHSFNGAESPFVNHNNLSKKVKKELQDKVFTHRVQGDAVSASSHVNGLGNVVNHEAKNVKKMKFVPEFLKPAINTVEQLSTHSIDNFISDKHLKKNKKEDENKNI